MWTKDVRKMATMVIMTAVVSRGESGGIRAVVPLEGAAPVIQFDTRAYPRVRLVRIRHVPADWDVYAPPETVELPAGPGGADVRYTAVPFGTSMVEYVGEDGRVMAARKLEKLVAQYGCQYVRVDGTNVLFGTSIYHGLIGLTNVISEAGRVPVHYGRYPHITIHEARRAADGRSATVRFSCAYDGTFAVWSDSHRIVARSPYRAGEERQIRIDADELALLGAQATLRIENGYMVAITPIKWDMDMRDDAVTGSEVGVRTEGAAKMTEERRMEEAVQTVETCSALSGCKVARCVVRVRPQAAGSGHIAIELTAESERAPEEQRSAGVFDAAGIVASGVWLRINLPAHAAREVYRYKDETPEVRVQGVARWQLARESGMHRVTVRMVAREVTSSFYAALREGRAPLVIRIGWGRRTLEWRPEMVWTRSADGEWTGTLADEGPAAALVK